MTPTQKAIQFHTRRFNSRVVIVSFISRFLGMAAPIAVATKILESVAKDARVGQIKIGLSINSVMPRRSFASFARPDRWTKATKPEKAVENDQTRIDGPLAVCSDR